MPEIIYNCPCPCPKHSKEYFLYSLYLGSKKLNYVKFGTSNDPARRFKELARYYNCDIIVNWISPPMTKYSALRYEDQIREEKIKAGWTHVPNDRFIKPARVKTDKIKLRKVYEFSY